MKELPPQPDKLIYALRKIGYGLEQSISDLIDNSISANATDIRIRFVYDSESVISMAIIDNGLGMSGNVIDEAMRFGSDIKRDINSLGKFGMGMKLASIGHANDLTVLSKSKSEWLGRRWTVKNISNGWLCDELSIKNIRQILKCVFYTGKVPDYKSGTVIYWREIDSIKTRKTGVENTIKKLIKRLRIHIGLHFHRFLEIENNLVIHIDAISNETNLELLNEQVVPLNPFPDKENAPTDDFPATFKAEVAGVGPLSMKAYIWPPNSDEAQYKLGGRAASMQGFYFYRNNRLLQAGGWNGLVNSDSEPHGSLARVAINLPVKYDSHFSVNVQKDKVNVPESFIPSLRHAKTDSWLTFFEYRVEAQKIYRKKSDKAKLQKVVIPAKGIPRPVVKKIKRQAINVYEREGKPKPNYRGIKFEWVDFKEENIFQVDRDTDSILLNKAFRNELLLGAKGSPTDIPLIKMLILFLVQDDFKKTKTSFERKKELDYINKVLISTLRFRRKPSNG
ncbi:ATP-binding protein [Pleionea mediterranea]|uniref:Histidine kinase/DNA gyrase B/HSP90-like ATPase n=1 Tax=Pleionea mediterranea TaxID=523701 RepID=A0A316FG56_9GAMM|nr:ATP-binding protein [Pleionea mediterranea]PWK47911.1 histidine kinase/DNA gyrase B/HSP90-like ATPase [Pleionea mediterranea]